MYLHQALHLHLRFSADALTYRISQIQAYTIHELNNLLSYGDVYIFYEFFGVEYGISRHSNLQVVWKWQTVDFGGLDRIWTYIFIFRPMRTNPYPACLPDAG